MRSSFASSMTSSPTLPAAARSLGTDAQRVGELFGGGDGEARDAGALGDLRRALRAANGLEHLAHRLVDRTGLARSGAQLVEGRPVRAVHRVVVPPAPDLFADEGQCGRKEALEDRERDLQCGARRLCVGFVAFAVGASLHELDVVVAEGPEERSRCARARARSRSARRTSSSR